MTEEKLRIFSLAGSLFAGCACVGVLSLVLDPGGNLARFLLDRQTVLFLYPFTIQNLMWLMFFVAVGELCVRMKRAVLETSQMQLELLPEDEESMLRAQDLGIYYMRAKENTPGKECFLQRIIRRTILQFQSSRSVNQANSLLNSSLELFQHEVDLRYNMLRYIVWLIPTLGFIGTVVGIAQALYDAGKEFKQGIDLENAGGVLVTVTESLGVAFYTTLLALLLSAVIVFMLHIAQAKEERALNSAGQYCLDNLINRLYEK